VLHRCLPVFFRHLKAGVRRLHLHSVIEARPARRLAEEVHNVLADSLQRTLAEADENSTAPNIPAARSPSRRISSRKCPSSDGAPARGNSPRACSVGCSPGAPSCARFCARWGAPSGVFGTISAVVA
jgi:hypothetical protein